MFTLNTFKLKKLSVNILHLQVLTLKTFPPRLSHTFYFFLKMFFQLNRIKVNPTYCHLFQHTHAHERIFGSVTSYKFSCPSVGWLVSRSVGLSVYRSVCYNLLSLDLGRWFFACNLPWTQETLGDPFWLHKAPL